MRAGPPSRRTAGADGLDEPSRGRFLGVFLDAAAEAGARPPSDVPGGPDFFRFSEEGALGRLLAGQGLEGIETTEIAFVHPAGSADELWHGLLAGTVRTSALVFGQTDDVQRRIRVAFERLVAPYRVGARLELPVSVRLAAARKPA